MTSTPKPATVLLFLLIQFAVLSLQSADEKPFGIDRRIPWTTSKVLGSPEPPLPYMVERMFTNIVWKSPLYVAPEPGTDFLVVVLQGGEKDRPSKILRVRDDSKATTAEPFLTMTNRLIYSVLFDPGYRTNGWMYVFSNGPTPEQERTNRISRFTVNKESPPACDPQSEKIIIEWRSAGHDGGGMVFGHDGMFYITSGDGTSDSDGWVTGQDISDLEGGVLRIDLSHPGEGHAYSVPQDNPFVDLKDARPELWAYGLRNPWRISIDEKTGQIWVGNNGQDLWESAHLIRRGENYGWSVYEGSHPFYLNRKLGPTQPVPPTIEHHHSEMRSLTGGIVYYGEELAELNGAYVYGDYSTGSIWAARHDGRRLLAHETLAATQLQIAAFAQDHHSNLLIVDHTGGIYRLVPNVQKDAPPQFPIRLSETGIFSSTREHRVEPGVIAYSVIAPGWNDGATAERFLAVPGEARVDYTSSEGWNFPEGTALVQTLSMEMEPGNSESRRRIETRLLTKQNAQWVGYSYAWNPEQTDAVLVSGKGEEHEFVVSLASGGTRRKAWNYPSRSECMACHSRAANFVLGLSELQMNRDHNYGTITDNQIRTLDHISFFKDHPKERTGRDKLVNPYAMDQKLEARARSYLQVNCSPCHVEAGGGNSRMELGFGRRAEKMNLVGARPQHDTFGIDNAMLIFPGDPSRSVLLQRLSRRGRGQMPPLVTAAVDETAVQLFREWISSMKSEQQVIKEWTMDDLLPLLSLPVNSDSKESGRAIFNQSGCSQCHRYSREGGGVGPDLTDIARRLSPHDILESIVLPSKTIAEGYTITEIDTTSGDSITGRVEREDDSIVIIRPTSGTGEPMKLEKKSITQRTVSKLSLMPAGIINTLSESQISDLLSFLLSTNTEH